MSNPQISTIFETELSTPFNVTLKLQLTKKKKNKSKKKKKKRVEKLSKDQIGSPENFQHIQHIGIDPCDRFGSKQKQEESDDSDISSSSSSDEEEDYNEIVYSEVEVIERKSQQTSQNSKEHQRFPSIQPRKEMFENLNILISKKN